MKANSVLKTTQAAVLTAFVAAGSAKVMASEDLDVTMRMVTDDTELSESVIREIELPSVEGLKSRARMPDNAGAPRSEAGQEARERGREFGQAMSERARESRDMAPSVPERPAMPERPQRPELPEAAARDR